MWCAIQVALGHEDAMANRISDAVPSGALEECFCPRFETQMKVRGTWVPCTRIAFPGYLFALTSDPRRLRRHLSFIDEPAYLLMRGDEPARLDPDLVEFYEGCTSRGRRVVPMSFGRREGDGVVVTSGPLVGLEPRIAKVNRGKSLAFLSFGIPRERSALRVGLGILPSAAKSAPSGLSAVKGDLEERRGNAL